MLHKYDFPPELALRAASRLTHLENPVEKADSVLSFLTQSGFSNSQLMKIVKHKPRFLAARLGCTIKRKIKTLQDVGFSSDDIAEMISTSPRILSLSVENNIVPSLSVMKELYGSYDEVVRLRKLSKWFLTSNIQKTLLPNIEFLKSCGIPMERIRIILVWHPSSFTVKPEVMTKCAEKAEQMGIYASSKKFIYAIWTLAEMSNKAWELKLQGFRNLGFSDNDIVTMFRKDPRTFSVSMEKVKKVTEVLLASGKTKETLLAAGKFDISSIVNCPRSLLSSIENRYIPRLQILGILETKSLIKQWPSLSTICRLSDKKKF
ncbi:hypothetical protein ACS0TY_013366 [Phlomoides rotata]